ncbi:MULTISPECIES: 5-carboxymethyl-2-hydroxymuconate Delta-isomerase [Geobacillus]|uniref:5-carboxymethyl-2-hydroxymuconate isomerase n=1 Tax=Geobacillus thermocatenulatus TaxID=33938 RepID=A0A226QC65_9BACL|nr:MULTISPECIES: 5-carboxymethyl-2-hydroxymuconate Delta-isomerase [Geobacillus]ASS98283.1 5-carboxymethyl-2-hydroxymuconate isomerase [Geobacillus thermocatenulatus]KLR74324.1 5-carboxymethyl-2-hydroxymuconate isomerase [Geobacillus sp. T6]OXB89042.1 5-carboxymethyl-2-hydroxymuconate isomerase [Geobacillus thermocatenulatus]RAN22376.1 5-carboxymethyl-2-hydroxymuconate isomerase [Geobacillus sp. A8]
MPHFIVEYTANLGEEADIRGLLEKVHRVLIKRRDSFPVGGIRSRAIRLDEYYVADGAEDDAFVHATLKIGAGRPEQVKKEVGAELFAVMKDHFAPLFAKRYLALSLELYEFSEAGTYKHNNIHARYRT